VCQKSDTTSNLLCLCPRCVHAKAQTQTQFSEKLLRLCHKITQCVFAKIGPNVDAMIRDETGFYRRFECETVIRLSSCANDSSFRAIPVFVGVQFPFGFFAHRCFQQVTK
jgi:hypothetical protein